MGNSYSDVLGERVRVIFVDFGSNIEIGDSFNTIKYLPSEDYNSQNRNIILEKLSSYDSLTLAELIVDLIDNGEE